MAFVGEDEGVVGQIFEQGRRRLAGLAAGEPARIILDAGAGAGGLDHLEVEGGALLEALRLQQLPRAHEIVEAPAQLVLDALDRLQQGRARRHIMRIGVDLDVVELGRSSGR